MTNLSHNHNDHKAVTLWLLFMMGLVTLMIVIGGATRLTNSGLSITEWAPIRGALPPLSDAAWLSEFEKYQQIPEFSEEHPDMELSGFKFIYFWEWSHRQLGRFIGLAYALPFFIFLLRGKLPKGHRLKYFAIMLLIGLQGVIGWWMVHSGLQEGMVDVSQYRLATHLGLAFIILGSCYWLMKRTQQNFAKQDEGRVFKKRTTWLGVLVYLQIIAGAFVAGTKSGKTYNEWPLMDGDIVPSGYFAQNPAWKNIFENAAAIQFNHRTLAYIILVLSIWVFISAKTRAPHLRAIAGGMLGILLWQVMLGIWTLLAVAPLTLSLLHQFSSILVFIVAIGMAWAARYRKVS
ncbi:MAG: COX15/CtaA family protein [Litorimonas sp.]